MNSTKLTPKVKMIWYLRVSSDLVRVTGLNNSKENPNRVVVIVVAVAELSMLITALGV